MSAREGATHSGGGTLLRPGIGVVAPSAQGAATNFSVVPDERTNSLIVLASPLEMRQIKDLVEKLDIRSPTQNGRLHVYHLKYAPASEMVQVLNGLLGGGGGPSTLSPATGKNSLGRGSSLGNPERLRPSASGFGGLGSGGSAGMAAASSFGGSSFGGSSGGGRRGFGGGLGSGRRRLRRLLRRISRRQLGQLRSDDCQHRRQPHRGLRESGQHHRRPGDQFTRHQRRAAGLRNPANGNRSARYSARPGLRAGDYRRSQRPADQGYRRQLPDRHRNQQ